MEMKDVIAPTSTKQNQKGRKLGRNKKKCARYRLEGRREKNKARKKVRNYKREARLQRLREKKTA